MRQGKVIGHLAIVSASATLDSGFFVYNFWLGGVNPPRQVI
jgi:hypothetical protein